MIELDDDALDMLLALDEENADYLIIGAHALAAHGVIRATLDVDLWVRPTAKNALATYNALVRFGAPVSAHGVGKAYFAKPDRVYQIGLPPRRIDLLSSISGVTVREGFSGAVVLPFGGAPRKVLSIAMLIQNKRATGRTKDLADVERLQATHFQP